LCVRFGFDRLGPKRSSVKKKEDIHQTPKESMWFGVSEFFLFHKRCLANNLVVNIKKKIVESFNFDLILSDFIYLKERRL
jgi:hypothetical protein